MAAQETCKAQGLPKRRRLSGRKSQAPHERAFERVLHRRRLLDSRSSDPLQIPLLQCFWQDDAIFRSGVFRRPLIVEKTMLWYTKRSMGRKRRSREFKNNSQVIDIEQARKERLEKRRAEKAKEEEKIRYAASQNTRGKMAIRKAQRRRRILIGIIVVCIIGVVAFSVLNVISLKKEQKNMREQQEALEKEKAQLEKELSEINDPENIEEQAREQLRLIKKGEYLYVFPEDMIEDDEASEDKSDKEE